jgi:O-methyltransferase
MLTIIKSIAAKIPPAVYDRCRAWSVLEHNLRSRLAGARRFNTRETLWREMFSSIGAGEKLLVLEFGVFDGYSIHQFSELNHNPGSKFIGFDSFEGLPEAWTPKCPKGTFSQEGKLPTIRDARISFVKGWFSDTVITSLQGIDTRDCTVLCHFDADLYSSTLFCLTAVLQRFPAFYFIFDEFCGQEARALGDVMQAYPIELSFLGQTLGKFPEQVSGKVINRSRF